MSFKMFFLIVFPIFIFKTHKLKLFQGNIYIKTNQLMQKLNLFKRKFM